MTDGKFTLGIETGIQGGSLSLLKDNTEIDFWIGNKNISKAEDILEQISEILKANGLKKVDFIAVSTGPGSATGLRIGLATAFGLGKSWACQVLKISTFEAILLDKQYTEASLLAVPFGSRQIAWGIFEPDDVSQLKNVTDIIIGTSEEFMEMLENQDFTNIIIHNTLVEVIPTFDKINKKFEVSRIEILSDKIATFIGANIFVLSSD